jgi:hypothetical protein
MVIRRNPVAGKALMLLAKLRKGQFQTIEVEPASIHMSKQAINQYREPAVWR